MALVIKNPPATAGDVRDTGSIPGWGRSRGEGHSNSLQYSCLENPMDRGAWWAMVLRITKNPTWLKCLSPHIAHPKKFHGYPRYTEHVNWECMTENICHMLCNYIDAQTFPVLINYERTKRSQVYKLHEYTFEHPSVFKGFGWSLWQRMRSICSSGPGQRPQLPPSRPLSAVNVVCGRGTPNWASQNLPSDPGVNIWFLIRKQEVWPLGSLRPIPTTTFCGSMEYFFKFLFIFDCTESSLLLGLFSSCSEWGLLSSCSEWASHSGGFSCCAAWISDAMAPGLQSVGSVVLARRLSCPTAHGIFPGQRLNPCLLHWQADSSPLTHQGSSVHEIFIEWSPGMQSPRLRLRKGKEPLSHTICTS